MWQLQVQIRSLLTPHMLNFFDREKAQAAFDVMFNRRKQKLSEIVTISDDRDCSITLDCTEIIVVCLVNTDTNLKINAENHIKQQVFINQATMAENAKPRFALGGGI